MNQQQMLRTRESRAMRYASLFVILSFVSVSAFAQAAGAVMQSGGQWSPYLVGALIGTLVCLTLYFSEEPVGASSFYATVAGLLGKAVAPKHTMQLTYYKEKPPAINWEFVFVIAAVFGSALAALMGGEFAFRGLPQMWVNQYGEDSWAQYAALSFGGGMLMAFGARLAGGCTSGHGISGTSQLSVSSWISLVCFFVGGVIAVRFIY